MSADPTAPVSAPPAPGPGGREGCCTGCDSPRIVAIRAVLAGQIACCPDCSTLTLAERNEIRAALAARPAGD